ncbi:MAG: CPBP family intramembrane metalloprotease [Anaerolineae bacterium]|nr:CPBP family intramembrane metalloprotease [Anaerolineae bacterium]
MTTDSRLCEPPVREFPSRLAANVYLVVGIAILIVSSRPETPTLTRYAIGIAAEVALAALAVLFMRSERLDIAATARLRRPALREVGLAILAVPGLWVAGVLLNFVSSLVLGYTTPAMPSQYPSTILEAVALAVTTMVVAPICEELMFRGYVQRAYERRNAWIGILVGGLIFTLYHLRFQGAPALLPVAIALSLIAWRTGSIVPGIALHAAYNTIATVLMIALSFLSLQIAGGLTAALVCLAVLSAPVSVAALWMLWRDTSPSPRSPIAGPRAWQRWAARVPVVGLIALYGYAAATEVLIGAFPELISVGPLRLGAAPADWNEAASWRYSIRNSLGEDIGEAACTRELDRESITLTCDADYEGYDITSSIPGIGVDLDRLPGSLQTFTDSLRTEPKSWSLAAHWARDTLELTALDAAESTPALEDLQLRYRVEDGRPSISAQGDSATNALTKVSSGSILLPYEWAWRLSAMPLELAYAADATIVQLSQEGHAQLHPAVVNVQGAEPTWTPAGTFVAWKVVVSWDDESGREQQQTAWYDSDAPHTLLGFDDGVVSYALQSLGTVDEGTE